MEKIKKATWILLGSLWGWLGTIWCWLSYMFYIIILEDKGTKEWEESSFLIPFCIGAIVVYIMCLVIFIVASRHKKQRLLFFGVTYAIATVGCVLRMWSAYHLDDMNFSKLIKYMLFLP